MSVSERGVTGSWTVHRQDDNGNRFVVRAGLDREEAIRLAAELEAQGHKQLYWVEAATGPNGPPANVEQCNPADPPATGR